MHLEHGPKRREAEAVQGTGAQLPKRCAVLGCTVPLVAGKAIAGKAAVTLLHQPITVDLGDDGGCCNGENQRVAMGQAVLGKRHVGQPQVVDQQEVGGRVEAIQGPAHGEPRGSHDAYSVDVALLHHPHRRRECVGQDARQELLAARGRELLGVADRM